METLHTLQINTKGAWRSVLDFAPHRRAEIVDSLASLAGILGESASWCILRNDGRREWLRDIHLGVSRDWQDITDEQPAALEDVMVSVFSPGDDEPLVFMAYRKVAGSREFFLSGGTADEEVKGVYAFSQICAAAPLPLARAAA